MLARGSGKRAAVHESKHLPADGEGKRHNEKHKECHLRHKEKEHLYVSVSSGSYTPRVCLLEAFFMTRDERNSSSKYC